MIVCAGGVFGLETITDGCSSTSFRHLGGVLYLHTVGWLKLTDQHKKCFADIEAKSAVEITFGNGERHDVACVDQFQREYLDYDIVPEFLLSNTFANRNQPDRRRWYSFIADYRERGYQKPIYPIVELQNRKENVDTLTQQRISRLPYYQEFIHAAGGIAIDTAAKYFFDRKESYREWIVDAINWTHLQERKAVLIISPWNSQSLYEESTVEVLDYLKKNGTGPDIVVVENYKNIEPSREYIPKVGREWIDDTCLGVGLHLLENYLKELKP